MNVDSEIARRAARRAIARRKLAHLIDSAREPVAPQTRPYAAKAWRYSGESAAEPVTPHHGAKVAY